MYILWVFHVDFQEGRPIYKFYHAMDQQTGQQICTSICETLTIHEEKTKEIMSVKESRYRSLLIFINFNFDFLALYKTYFQNYLFQNYVISTRSKPSSTCTTKTGE